MPDRMPKVTRVPVPGEGPEDPVIAPDGTVYTSLKEDGRVLAIAPDRQTVREVAAPGGRGLGIEFLPDDQLLLCNTGAGRLETIDLRSGTVQPLADSRAGRGFVFLNNASVAADGTIYVTDSSDHHGVETFSRDLIEATSSGTLWRIAPGGTPEELARGLDFANGVALSSDERFLIVAETGSCRLRKVSLPDGIVSHFADLPGHPDNILLGSDGLFWVAIPALRNTALGAIRQLPLPLRRMIAGLPEWLQPKPARVCRVMAFDPFGTLVHDLEGDPDDYHYVTGVRERDGIVWLGSIEEDALGWFALRA